MSVSKASKSSLATFARYNVATAGNSSGVGVFALQAGSSSTHYVSSDGLTWTAYALTNPFATFNFCLYSSTVGGWMFASSGMNYQIYKATPTFTTKPRTITNGSWAIGATWQGAYGYCDTGRDILWANDSSTITDNSGQKKWKHATANQVMQPPAYDGNTTWAVVRQSTNAVGQYSTGDSSPGDGVLPWYDTTAQNGWASWTDFALPLSTNWNNIKYVGGYWYITNNSGVIYHTANIATASPSWTNNGTILNSPLFIANNEVWVLPFWGAGTTAYKSTPGSGSFTAITLPANKQCTGIAYGNGTYIIATSDGTIYRSTTGASGSFSNISTGATSTTVFSMSPIAFGAA